MSPTGNDSILIAWPLNLSKEGRVELPSLWSTVIVHWRSFSRLWDKASAFAASEADDSTSLGELIVPSNTGFHQLSSLGLLE